MLGDITAVNDIYIICGYTDMRKSIDGLCTIIRDQLKMSPEHSNALYLFCGRRSDRIKAILHEKDGFVLLFRPFSVRFSLKKERYVKILQKFNDDNLNGGKVKNQIVMDALEMYFNAMKGNSDTQKDKLVTKQFFEQRLEQFKQE